MSERKEFRIVVREILKKFKCEDRLCVINVDLAIHCRWPINIWSINEHIVGLVCIRVSELPSGSHIAVFELEIQDDKDQEVGVYELCIYKSNQIIDGRRQKIIAPILLRSQKSEVKLAA